jgi:hypothetical protein
MIGSKHEWFNLNSLRCYPFAENDSSIFSGVILPNYLIVDINIAINSNNIIPELSCINVSPYIVSISIRDQISGNDIATATCMISDEYSIQDLNACSDIDITGKIVFGDLSRIKEENIYGLMKFESSQYTILNYCYFCTGTKVLTGAKINGVDCESNNISIVTNAYLKTLVSSSTNNNNTKETDVVFYVNKPESFKKICEIPETLCSCPELPIQKINTVYPDSNGNIEIIVGSYKLVNTGVISEYQLEIISPVTDLSIFTQDDDIVLALDKNSDTCEETEFLPFPDGRLPSESDLTN